MGEGPGLYGVRPAVISVAIMPDVACSHVLICETHAFTDPEEFAAQERTSCVVGAHRLLTSDGGMNGVGQVLYGCETWFHTKRVSQGAEGNAWI